MSSDDDIYKKILFYYDLSDNFMELINSDISISESTRGEVLIPLASKIKRTADFLMETYVMFLKTNKNSKFKSIILDTLDKLLFEISVCKNKLYSLSKKN